MLTPALIMCTSVPTFFFLVFIFFGERWCNEGGEASWLHLSLAFLDVTSPHPLSLSLYPESNISLHGLLLLGDSWPRSSIHANSLRLVGSILSCYGCVVKLTGVSEKNRFWPKKKKCFCCWRILFSWRILVKVSFSERSFCQSTFLRELWPAIVFPGSE